MHQIKGLALMIKQVRPFDNYFSIKLTNCCKGQAKYTETETNTEFKF